MSLDARPADEASRQSRDASPDTATDDGAPPAAGFASAGRRTAQQHLPRGGDPVRRADSARFAAAPAAPAVPEAPPARDGQWDRRIAAHRAFVETKLAFIKLAAEVDGRQGERLQQRVRRAQDVSALLALQLELVAAVPRGLGRTDRLRRDLARQLERLLTPSLSGFGRLA